jgi:hypothetical protein
MKLVVLALLLAACGSKKRANGEECKSSLDCVSDICMDSTCTAGRLGDPCVKNYQCDYRNQFDCIRGTCRQKSKREEACEAQTDCDYGLQCELKKCLDEAGIKREQAKADAEQRVRDAEQERSMLEQAGAAPAAGSAAVEKAAFPPGPGTRIRTATITGKQFAIAACKADERLESGGCKAEHVLASYPSGQSELDTVGARWNCTVGKLEEVTAYALCSKLP